MKPQIYLTKKDGIPSFSLLFVSGTALCPDAEDRIAAMAEMAKPDFILFGGDILPENTTAEEARELLNRLTGSCRKQGIPFAHLFGDRDFRSGIPAQDQLRLWQELPLCLSGEGETDTSNDYVLSILSENGEPVLNLWCMNSHAEVFAYEKEFGSPTPARLPKPLYTEHYLDGVHFNQSLWYWHKSARMEAQFGKAVPGAIFSHIPVPEFVAAAMNANQTRLTGTVGGAIRCQTVNGGLFTAAAERHDVKTIVAAHNGDSSFTAHYAGLDLVMTPGLGSSLGDGVLFTWKAEENGTLTERHEVLKADRRH